MNYIPIKIHTSRSTTIRDTGFLSRRGALVLVTGANNQIDTVLNKKCLERILIIIKKFRIFHA